MYVCMYVCMYVYIYIYIYIYITSIGSGTGTVLKVSIWHRYRKKSKRYPTLVIIRVKNMKNSSCVCVTCRRAGGGGVSCAGEDEEGLDEGAQSVDDVSEDFGGVLLHVVGLTERPAQIRPL